MSDLYFFDDVGEHRHTLLRDSGATSSDGPHAHVWHVSSEIRVGNMVIPDNTLLLSGYDGAHDHQLRRRRTQSGGSHRHGVRMPNRKVVSSEQDGAHDHVLLVSRTGWDGPHQHSLKVGDQTLVSLMPDEFVALMDAAESSGEGPVVRSCPQGTAVVKGDEILCTHKSRLEATWCGYIRKMLWDVGIKANLLCENVTNAADWLCEEKEREQLPPGVKPDRLLGALNALVEEG